VNDKNFSLCLGVVKNNSDPAQLGRLQVFVPSSDPDNYVVDDLPWAIYVSPFAGTTANAMVGREQSVVPGVTSYGFWAIPKNGSQVLIGFLEGNPKMRIWLGCFFLPEMNRTMPQGIDGTKTEIDKTNGVYPQSDIISLVKNMTEAGLGPDHPNFKTVGGYERSITHPSNKNKNKPTDNGYAPKPLEPEKADSQGYCWVTPGRHYIYMSDVDGECRMRIKTSAGSQILMDDTNERIYISTAKGRSYVELDEGSGMINHYSASKVNIHAENDLNFFSDQNINIVAKKRVNIVSEERAVKVQGYLGVELLTEAGDVKITASRSIHVLTTDGKQGEAVSEQTTPSLPPYAGNPLGVLRDYAEAGGSAVSSIFLSAAKAVDMSAKGGDITVTASSNVNLAAVGGILKGSGSEKVTLVGGGSRFGLGGGCVTDGPFTVDGSILCTGSVNSNSTMTAPVFTIGAGGVGGGKTAGIDAPHSAQPAVELSGESIADLMIIPLHESWERGEDDAIAPIDRNKNYKG